MEELMLKLASDLPSTAVLMLLIILWDRQVKSLILMAEKLLGQVNALLEKAMDSSAWHRP
jgi:hypothetical protein